MPLSSLCVSLVGALALAGLVTLPVRAQESLDHADPVEHVGFVEHEPANEISGIVKSSTYEDVYWVHNDSGGGARLFAIDGGGHVIMPGIAANRFRVGPASVPDGRPLWPGVQILVASNFDWEDIALADGRLYISDMGNNGNARRDLGVYVVNEPNPRAVPVTRSLRFLPVRYSDQKVFPGQRWHFDSEALFVSGGKLYFLTKHRPAGQMDAEAGTKLYRLDSEYTDRENVLTLVGSRADIVWPTAASVSPDGESLAVLTLETLWLFSRPPVGDDWLAGHTRRIALPRERTKQAEAVCWDDARTLRIANEQRDLFTLDLAAVETVSRSGSRH